MISREKLRTHTNSDQTDLFDQLCQQISCLQQTVSQPSLSSDLTDLSNQLNKLFQTSQSLKTNQTFAHTPGSAERLLRESEEKYRALFTDSPDAYLLISDGVVIDCNRACEKMLRGYRTQIVGKQPAELSPEFQPDGRSSRQAANEAMHTALQEGSLRFEWMHRRLDQTDFWVEVSLVVTTVQDRLVLFSAWRDITERKRVEEALEKRLLALTQPVGDIAEITFESLFKVEDIQRLQDAFAQATTVASVITRPDGVPITQASNFTRLCFDIVRQTETGRRNCYKSDAELGKVCLDGPIIRPCLSCGLWDAGASITVAGKHIASWLIGQVRDETQTEEQIRAYAREIGAEEQQAVEAFHEVPAMPRERFEQVAQAVFILANQLSGIAYQNLQQAHLIWQRRRAEQELARLNKQLTEKNRELEQVVYVASHDLRSPLVNIDGYSREVGFAVEEMTQAMETPDVSVETMRAVVGSMTNEINEALRYIRNSAAQMDLLLSGLLKLSRLGRAALHITTLDMNELVARVIESVDHQTRLGGIAILVDELPPCQGDAVQIGQVFGNLIGNAIKYLDPTRQGRIHVSAEISKPQVIYRVKDNGIGIDPAHQDKIFEVFHRLEPGKAPGDGLGLTIVKQALGRQGGEVWVESMPGEGSTFCVALPAA